MAIILITSYYCNIELNFIVVADFNLYSDIKNSLFINSAKIFFNIFSLKYVLMICFENITL